MTNIFKTIGWILIVVILAAGALLLLGKLSLPVWATNPPVITICHHTPANQVTLNFQTWQAYFGHLGTPHSGQTYDTQGACTQPTPTPSPTPSVTPTPTPEVTPTPTPEVTPTPTPDPCQPQELELVRLALVLDEVPCPTPTPEPTPTPTVTPVPEEPKSSSTPSAPVCTDGNTSGAVANPHVYRNGSTATVNFFVTDGDKSHVFYKEVDAANWQYSVANVGVNADNFGSVTINDLDPNKGYTFGIMQVEGCGGGSITAVVVDGPEPTLFNLSYWLFN